MEMPYTTEILPGSTVSTAKNQQRGEWIIKLHCVFKNYLDADGSFEIIEPILWQIYCAIQGVDLQAGTAIFSSLIRVLEVQDVDHDLVQDWHQDYMTSMIEGAPIDDSVTDQNDPVGTVTSDIEAEIVDELS
jgi:hypothetical protein